MDELKPLKEPRTTVIDKITEDVSLEDFEIKDTEEKKEVAKKILFNTSPESIVAQQLRHATSSSSVSTNAKIEFEAEKTFFSDFTEKEKQTVEENIEKTEVLNEPVVEKQEEVDLETEFETLITSETEEKNEVIEETKSLKRVKPKTGLKARLKVITFGFFAVLTCFLGWAIYNAVEIETLRAQMEMANKTYGVNIVNYINNLSKADDLTSDSLFNLEQLSEAGVLPLEPSELKDHVEYSVRSNWFDRFCNWLSGIFK
jgi:hypothetical protein